MGRSCDSGFRRMGRAADGRSADLLHQDDVSRLLKRRDMGENPTPAQGKLAGKSQLWSSERSQRDEHRDRTESDRPRPR